MRTLPKPYYQDDWVEIYHADCMDILPLLPDKSIQAVITDPPYGVRHEDWDKTFVSAFSMWLSECCRVSSTVLWFCADKMISRIAGEREIRRLLIWNKPPGSQFAGASNSNIWYSIEPILVFGELPKGSKKKRFGFSSFTYRTVPSAKYGHPTTKPLELMKELVYFHSEEDDVLLDPFMGSGTTLVAAKMLRRRAIGIEISEEYCEISAKRLAEVTS